MTLLVSRASVTGTWARLLAGDLGLARTFWLFYFGVGIVWNLGIEVLSRMKLIQAPAAFALLQILVAVYIVPVTVGVYRAAEKHKGNPGCARCAQAACILGSLGLLAAIFVLMSAGK